MRCGIVGLPQSGKTTLYRLLIKSGHGSGSDDRDRQARAHLGLLDIPDPRLEYIASIYKPERATPARLEFIDTPAFPLDRSQAAQSAAQLLADIREVDALVHVVGLHPLAAGADRDPAIRYRQLADEFVLADLEIIEKRLDRLQRDFRAGKKEGGREIELLSGLKTSLEAGTRLSSLALDRDSDLVIRGYSFLTRKPELVVLNAPDGFDRLDDVRAGIQRETAGRKSDTLVVYGAMELEICDLDPAEQADFLQDLGLDKLGADRLLAGIFNLLGLLRFYTANEREVRAWTVTAGTPAVEAAGKVHQDMQRGFIRAEVGKFDDLQKTGSWTELRNIGLLRLEGREYIVEDGDVIYFRFKV